jgi:hypothetical protein
MLEPEEISQLTAHSLQLKHITDILIDIHSIAIIHHVISKERYYCD